MSIKYSVSFSDEDKPSLHEIGNTYVSKSDRWVVSLVVGYSEQDGIRCPEDALVHALDLTRDGGSWDTHWYVFDRKTGEMYLLEQRNGEPDWREKYLCDECEAFIPDTEEDSGNPRHESHCSLHPDNIVEFGHA